MSPALQAPLLYTDGCVLCYFNMTSIDASLFTQLAPLMVHAFQSLPVHKCCSERNSHSVVHSLADTATITVALPASSLCSPHVLAAIISMHV